MSVKVVLYIDKKRREVLHVPFEFIVINYTRREPDFIFDLKRLGLWYNNWKKGRVSLLKIVGYPEIEQEDVDSIVGLVLEGKIDEAKGYCIEVFDGVINKEYGINSETRPTFRRELKCQ